MLLCIVVMLSALTRCACLITVHKFNLSKDLYYDVTTLIISYFANSFTLYTIARV